MVLLTHIFKVTYQCQRIKRGLTDTHISKSYAMTYVS
ncbi:hypothetical protein F383_16906 [Gossypium arboreum]|uniref:Uncharacterized protein n=1 Tax=Gossypium arboreum TaxID=29729 RepID=A0A0B0NP75_GOSAR|nr:hypothetical protein F383_16906 [Gossypium arboreum]